MSGLSTYKTVQGDTYDIIAKKVYGDELLMGKIVCSNPKYIGTMVFPSGVILQIPDATDKELKYNSLPPWRQDDE